MDYNARQYDPVLGRFTLPDTIILDAADSQAFDRYSYLLNNPVNFTTRRGMNRVSRGELGGCNASAVEEARDGVIGGYGGRGRNPELTDPEDRKEQLRMLPVYRSAVVLVP